MTELYDGNTLEGWLAELEKTRLDNRKLLYALWSLWGTPNTMLDIGCGSGDLVMRSRQVGIQAFGCDQLITDTYDKGWFKHHDLRMPFSPRMIEGAPSTVDLVLCWEVAEHIPEDYHTILCDTCANALHRGNKAYLVWTSAHPGQGGTEHISARPATFWREEFHRRKLNFMQNITNQVVIAWQNCQTGLFWMPANVQVFEAG